VEKRSIGETARIKRKEKLRVKSENLNLNCMIYETTKLEITKIAHERNTKLEIGNYKNNASATKCNNLLVPKDMSF